MEISCVGEDRETFSEILSLKSLDFKVQMSLSEEIWEVWFYKR